MSYSNLDSLADEIKDLINEVVEDPSLSKDEVEDFVEELVTFLKKF